MDFRYGKNTGCTDFPSQALALCQTLDCVEALQIECESSTENPYKGFLPMDSEMRFCTRELQPCIHSWDASMSPCLLIQSRPDLTFAASQVVLCAHSPSQSKAVWCELAPTPRGASGVPHCSAGGTADVGSD